MKHMIILIGFVVVAFSMCLAWAGPAVVVKSTDPKIQAGLKVPDGGALEVAAGKEIMVVTQDGKMSSIQGPHAGPLFSKEEKTPKGDSRVLLAVSRLLSPEAKDSSSLGAFRDDGEISPDDAAVAILSQGTHCVMTQEAPKLWRGNTSESLDLSLKLVKGGSSDKMDIVWPRNESTLLWPAGLKFESGGTYLVRTKGKPVPEKVNIHRADTKFATDWDKLLWLEASGCVKQAQKLLQTLTQ